MSKESNDLALGAGGCSGACACSGATNERGAMKRRDFVAYGAAALAMAALAACGGGESVTSPDTLSSTSIKVSDFPALATVGGVATTTVSGTPIAIVRTSTSTFSVFSRICPHQGSTINVAGSGFRCPNHGATFNLSGVWTGGERTRNLTSYPAQYDATTGTLTIG